MIKIFIFLTLLISNLLADEKDINFLLFQKQRQFSTITSLSAQDMKTVQDFYSLSYFLDRSNTQFLIDYTYLPEQSIGNTLYSSYPLEVIKKTQRFELGASYKYYLFDSLYVGPGIVYKHYLNKLIQKMRVGSKIINSESTSDDTDYSLYAIMGYQPFRATSIFFSLEMKNDIFSSNQEKDYSYLPIEISLLQFFTKKHFLYVKYGDTFRNKSADSVSLGQNSTYSISLGAGFIF